MVLLLHNIKNLDRLSGSIGVWEGSMGFHAFKFVVVYKLWQESGHNISMHFVKLYSV
jgi:hypothetical protein